MEEILLLDPKYLDLMHQIDTFHFIQDGKWDWEHGLGHATRTSYYSKDILTQLESDSRTVELGSIAALLHDIGLSSGNKKGHALVSAAMASYYLEKLPLSSEECNLIIQAIQDHSEGTQIQSSIGLALVLADKLDITYHRTVDSSIQDTINQNIQRIKEVTLIMNNDTMRLNYMVEEGFQKQLLNEWEKCLTIPMKIATYLKKQFIFELNGIPEDVSFLISAEATML